MHGKKSAYHEQDRLRPCHSPVASSGGDASADRKWQAFMVLFSVNKEEGHAGFDALIPDVDYPGESTGRAPGPDSPPRIAQFRPNPECHIIYGYEPLHAG